MGHEVEGNVSLKEFAFMSDFVVDRTDSHVKNNVDNLKGRPEDVTGDFGFEDLSDCVGYDFILFVVFQGNFKILGVKL